MLVIFPIEVFLCKSVGLDLQPVNTLLTKRLINWTISISSEIYSLKISYALYIVDICDMNARNVTHYIPNCIFWLPNKETTSLPRSFPAGLKEQGHFYWDQEHTVEDRLMNCSSINCCYNYFPISCVAFWSVPITNNGERLLNGTSKGGSLNTLT